VLALRGHAVRVTDRGRRPGGMLPVVAAVPGRERFAGFSDWLVAECARLGVRFEVSDVQAADVPDDVPVVLATGGRPGPRSYEVDDGARVVTAAELFAAAAGLEDLLTAGPVVVHDPVGDWVGVGVAELVAATGRPVTVVTPEQVVGSRLSRTGDLAPANTRLQRAGVHRVTTTLLSSAGPGYAVLADRWTGSTREVTCTAVVDCGQRLPDRTPHRNGAVVAGDALAPRTVLEAVLEGRRAALALDGRPADRSPVPA
jgi:hypothetical protein